MPRQTPKKGTRFSRAQRMAEIMPSTPRPPKPPGTITPPQPDRISPALSSVSCSESTQRMSTCTRLAMPPWVRASTTDR